MNDLTIWRVCSYLRSRDPELADTEDEGLCRCCPDREVDPAHGPYIRGCRAQAEAIVRIVDPPPPQTNAGRVAFWLAVYVIVAAVATFASPWVIPLIGGAK